MIQLPEVEYHVVEALAQADPPGSAAAVSALAEQLDVDQSQVHAAGVALHERGLVRIEESHYRELELEDAARALAEGDHVVLPERHVIGALEAMGGSGAITEVPDHAPVAQRDVGQSLRWLKTKGWVDQAGRQLTLTEPGRRALAERGADEQLLDLLLAKGTLRDEADTAQGVDLSGALALLKKRKGLLRVRERTDRSLVLEPIAQQAFDAGEIRLRRQVNLLTSDMMQDGSWRDVDFRPYDVTLDTDPAHPGKAHPFRRVLEQTRRAFLELGFTEIRSPLVESSFWDFDALFQPQDHPAREMQDTFYIERPATTQLPENRYVEAVARTHEDGGDTGSVGWRYRWSRDLARRPVLRTHCTAATVRALAADPQAPRKVFCVGPVFRRETVDYKHLPAFYQVDGIIIDEHASFASLLGTLDAFYRKMGFDKFTFRPAFFPYTEPSVEVFVWLEDRQDWIEMGGAGVFRPEVTRPAGCPHPVLAWGLGLERLAMVRSGLSDIRDLYLADLDWLKGEPLCR